MELRARDAMQSKVRTVHPQTSLRDLEDAFFQARVSGFPVVDDGRLVGIVSRSDVVRRLDVEQSMAETLSDYYRDAGAMEERSAPSLDEIGAGYGGRLERLRVKDVMAHVPISVSPDAPLLEVARTLVEHRIHRVPVVDGGRLAGIVTTLDLARLVAEGRLAAR